MKKTKKVFVIMLILMIGIVFKGIKIYADPLPIESLDGASIRTEGVQGLRFDARVLDSSGIVEKGFYLLKGAATVSDLTAAIPTMTYNGKTIFKVPVAGVSASNEFSIVLTGIPEQGYLDKITVIPYAELNNDSVFYCLPITRSIGQVAILMDQATQDPLPQGVQDVLDVLSEYRKSRISMGGDLLEVSKGVLAGTSYVNLDDYIFYPTNITTITLPIPEKTGYTFAGWYDTDNNLVISVSATSITGQTWYFSQWVHTVTFDSNGGSAVTSQTVSPNGKATKPADPTRDNYLFKGWFLNGELFDFNTAITSNITLVAEWHVSFYTYNFLDGGDSNNSDLSQTNILTNVSYASDNPSGTVGTTPWIANHADLSRTDGTRLAETKEARPSIQTNFKYSEVVSKIEVINMSYISSATNIVSIYIEYSTDKTSWTKHSAVPTSSGGTLTFNNLNIPAEVYIRLVVHVWPYPAGFEAGIMFTKIKLTFKNN